MDEDVTAGILFNHSFDDIDFFPTNSELRIKSVKYFKSFERVQNEVGKTHVDASGARYTKCNSDEWTKVKT